MADNIFDQGGSGWIPDVGTPPPPGYDNEFADKMADALNANDPELVAAMAAYLSGGGSPITVASITDATPEAKAFMVAVGVAAMRSVIGLGSAATQDSSVFAQTIHVHDAAQITSGVFDPARLPPSGAITNVVPAGGTIASLTAPEQSLITQGCFVTEADGEIWAYKGSGSKTLTASYVLTGLTQIDWINVLNKPATFAPSPHAASHSAGSTDIISLQNLAGTVPISKGGTGQVDAANAINALLPTQTSQSGKVLGTNGTVSSWVAAGGIADGDKGEITVAAGVWSIDAAVVTLAKMANLNADLIIGRANGAGAGVPQALTATQVRTIINVVNGATANDTDANLRARSSHTGTQLASTVSDFSTAADARISAASVNALSDVTITTPSTDQVLKYSAGQWINGAVSGGVGVTDGDKGDIVVSGSGATWLLDPAAIPGAVKFISVAAFSDLATLTYATVTAGDRVWVKATGCSYSVIATGATDQHLNYVGTGGVKLKVLPDVDGMYPALAWGLSSTGDMSTVLDSIWTSVNTMLNVDEAVGQMVGVRFPAMLTQVLTGTTVDIVGTNLTLVGKGCAVRLRDGPFLKWGSNSSVHSDGLSLEGFKFWALNADLPDLHVVAITAATQAATCAITTGTAHGWTTGQKIRITDVVGMTQLNNKEYTVTVTGGSTATLQGINSTGYTAYASAGIASPASDCAVVYVKNGSRVNFLDCKMTRCAHLIKAKPLTGCGATGLGVGGTQAYIRGHPSYSPVFLDMTQAAFGAGLFIHNIIGHPQPPPVPNPALLPKVITGISKAANAVVTCTGHGFVTGKRVRLCKVGGMTQISGVDAIITVINANSFSMDGINSTGYTTYTSGGWAAELHWSQPFDTALVELHGAWDTLKIMDTIWQHSAWLWKIRPCGTTVSYVWDANTDFDYGGKGRFKLIPDTANGTISNVKVDGGWTFCLDEKWMTIEHPGSGGGFVSMVEVLDHKIGMSGDSIIDDMAPTYRILELAIRGLIVMSVGRARRGTCYGIRTSYSGSMFSIHNMEMKNPIDTFGSGPTDCMIPDYGIHTEAGTLYDFQSCNLRASTTKYLVPLTHTAGGRNAFIRNNKCGDGTLPEYITTAAATVPTSAASVGNHTGLRRKVMIRGGTVTSITLQGVQIATATAATTPVTFEQEPGQDYSITWSGSPTVVYSYSD